MRKQDWMRIYHLYRLRRLRDAVDAELQSHQVTHACNLPDFKSQ